jgi:ribonuclease P protein component
VLPAERRVRRREDFTATVRGGRRAGAPGLVLHRSDTGSDTPARAGFIIGRSVGPAVQRNRLRRRLRHLIAPRLEQLPAGTMVVIRANPSATELSGRELAATLDRLLDRVGRHPAAVR